MSITRWQRALPMLLSLAMASLPGCSGCIRDSQDSATRSDTVAAQNSRPQSSARETSPAKNRTQGITGAAERSRPRSNESASSSSKDGTSPESAASRGPSSGSGAPRSPGDALTEARRLQRSADSKAAAGKYGDALDDANKAWALLHEFPDDSDCAALADDVYGDLETFAERADRSHGRAPPLEKPLIFK